MVVQCFVSNSLFSMRLEAENLYLTKHSLNYCALICTLECFIAIINCLHIFSHSMKGKNGWCLLTGQKTWITLLEIRNSEDQHEDLTLCALNCL